MNRPAVLVASYYDRRVTDPEVARLEPVAEVRRPDFGRRLNETELIENLQGVRIALISDEVFDETVFAASPGLEMIVTDGVGTDSIDMEAATRHGVIVNNAPFVHDANGEFTLGLILAVTRRIVSSDRGVRAGQWLDRARYIGRDLGGSTLGLLGFGRAARSVAKRAAAFGVNLIAYSPNADAEVARELGVRIVSFEELLADSDILSIHVTLNDSTRNLIDAHALGRMRDGAFLINTSRGAVVDEMALLQALESGKLAGAGLDVFAEEPPAINNPLFERDDVVVTAHIASDTSDAFRAVFRGAVDDILLFLDGRRPEHVRNSAVLSQFSF